MSDLYHIQEPKLTFGYGQKLQDPRDGLMLFGPFTRNKLKGQVNIGIVGPEPQRGYLREYLKRIHRPVTPETPDKARPSFPGLEAALRWCRFVRQPEGVFKQRPMVVGFTGFRQPFSRAVQQSKPGPGSAS